MMLRSLFKRAARDKRGSMTIETAIVAPVLGVLVLGTFETSMIVARQHELQSAATEIEMIALATNDGAIATHQQLKAIVRESLDLDRDEKVQFQNRYRCGTSETLVNNTSNCSEDDVISTYIQIRITDTYEPTWTSFGIGNKIDYEVDRMVQIS